MDPTVRPIFPVSHPLHVRVHVPGSKSHTNRALMLSALAKGITTLQKPLFSEDTLYFAEALQRLGFEVEMEPHGEQIIVRGEDGKIPAEKADLFIGNAGTAARFLTALLTLGNGSYRLDGSSRMRQRPIGDLVSALNAIGATVKPMKPQVEVDITPPLEINAVGLGGGTARIRGDVSSQFLSGLLMVAPCAEDFVEIIVDGPLHSKPYIDLTLQVMEDFGVRVERQAYRRFLVHPRSYLSPGAYGIEADVSSASYFFAAPAICGGWVEVSHISQKTRQGDIAFLDVLSAMGCQVVERLGAIRVEAGKRLCGLDVDMSDFPDTAMTLAAIAPFAESPTTIRGIATSRFKETDRVAAICTELSRLGVQVKERQDGMTIYPCEHILPGRVHTYDDHRIAMAFSLVGLRVPGIEIENPQCVAKTFPNFFEVLDSLQ